MILEAALKLLEPRPVTRTIDWAQAHGFTELGQPYSDFAYPHLSAPGGPFDAVDCGLYTDLWLQWASRLGKTFGGQIAMLKRVDAEPCPMMFASSDEKLALEVVERTYGMLENCLPLARQLPPPNRRKQSRISLFLCRVYVAWARSVSTLADKAVRFGHANEIDKWEHLTTSKEADPLKLFDDRFKEFITFIRWKEGTPALKLSSRIERGRLGSCNASLWVPCPKCGRHQILRMGDGTRAGGIVWEGKGNPELARSTARYVCQHCEEDIADEHRGQMMRSGVWVPEGCGVHDDKARRVVEEWRKPGRDPWGGWKDSTWITGTPVRDGLDWGSQLSSLYALSRTWGDITREFVDCHKNPQNLRNFVNQWLAETWELVRRQMTWEKLGERLIHAKCERAVIPAGYVHLVAAIDKQEDHFVVGADAWNKEGSSHTLDYGELDTEEEVLAWLGQEYRDVGGTRRRVSVSLFDSGFRPKGVYEFCDRAQAKGITVIPCRGSTKPLGTAYRKLRLGKGTTRPGAPYVLVDTITTQDWLDRQLHDRRPGEPGGTTLFKGALGDHQDFLEQLLNDAPVQQDDKNNHTTETWKRIDPSIPNDYRDVKRYMLVAWLLKSRGLGGDVSPDEATGWFAAQSKGKR